MLKLREFLADTLQVSKGSVKIPTKGIIEGYRERYNALVHMPSRKFRHRVYRVIPGGRILIHVKVPSETVDGLYYDVLLELSADKAARDFPDCDIKVFSNCPSFVYSVAYVFAHWEPDAGVAADPEDREMLIDAMKGKLPRNRMLVPGSEGKLGTKPIREPPVVRNPMGIPLFDKSLYYAIFHVMDTMDFRKTLFGALPPVSMAHVVASVADFESLMVERKRRQRRIQERRKKEHAQTVKTFRAMERETNQRNAGTLKPKSAMTPRSVSKGRKPTKPSGMKRNG